jgi:hypothetical protein
MQHGGTPIPLLRSSLRPSLCIHEAAPETYGIWCYKFSAKSCSAPSVCIYNGQCSRRSTWSCICVTASISTGTCCMLIVAKCVPDWICIEEWNTQIVGNKHFIPRFCDKKNSSSVYPRHDGIWGSRGIAPVILNLLNLSISWKCVNIRPRPLPLTPPLGKEFWYPLNKKLCGPQSRSEQFWKKEKSLAFAGIRTGDCPACSLVILSTKPAVPKLCSADPNVFATSLQGIRGYISVMLTLKRTYSLN